MYNRQKSTLICVRCGNECYERDSSCPRCGASTQVNTSEDMLSAWSLRTRSPSTHGRHNRARSRPVPDRGAPACRNGRVAGLALCTVVLLAAAAFLPRPTGHRAVEDIDVSASIGRTAVGGSVAKDGGNAAKVQVLSAPVASAPLRDADATRFSNANVSAITVSVTEPDSTNISGAHRASRDGDLNAARKMLSEVSPGGKGRGDFLEVQADLLRLEGRRNRLIRQALACGDAEEWTCVSINARKALNIDRRSQIAKTLLARAAAVAAQTGAADGTTNEEGPEGGIAPQ
jgi:hypothetical protein